MLHLNTYMWRLGVVIRVCLRKCLHMSGCEKAALRKVHLKRSRLPPENETYTPWERVFNLALWLNCNATYLLI